MESLSTQARQVLDQLKRPDVDFIHGLSPVLAIEQRTGGVSPRTTIATVTEVSDYARLLWAIAGEQRCPKDGGRVVRRSLDDNVERILAECAGERVMLLAPVLRAKPSVLRDELPRLRQRGFQRDPARRARKGAGRGEPRPGWGGGASPSTSSSTGWSPGRSTAAGSPTRSSSRSARAATARSSSRRRAPTSPGGSLR